MEIWRLFFFQNNPLSKENYRPVSVLPIISKVFEKLMQNQINLHIKSFLSSYLCGYRKSFNSQHALISLIERWRKSLDNKGYEGAVLMDLSKAFDTLNHDLLIAKLHAYGFDIKTLKLLHSYLTIRWQRTKVNSGFSTAVTRRPSGFCSWAYSFQYLLKWSLLFEWNDWGT